MLRFKTKLLSGALSFALVALGAAAFSPATYAAHVDPAFYLAATNSVTGAPGSIVRIEPMRGAPLGASAYRLLYRSTDPSNRPIVVSGVVVIPAGVAPKGGRPIVAWSHPTTGVVSRCAPSQARFVFQTMMGLRDMVRRGYVVVATDYPGLGTPGPHPYLVGDSEARAVLDSVRAVRNLPQAAAGNRYAVWGHSQGGQAALFAGELAQTYAPELQLVGVAVASPATDLQTLLREDADTDGGRNITAMTLWSWSQVFHLPLDNVIAPGAMPAVDALSNECIESPIDMLERSRSQRPLRQQFLSVDDITRVEPWRSLLLKNIPGTLPADVPVFVAQGDADRLVLPSVTQAYVQRLCHAGSKVQYLSLPGVKHGWAGADAALPAVAWMADRFDGKAAPDSCGSLAD
ncbi:alpha/beta fold hydrolase [Dyella flava]|uniref:Alpha/beta fold hydrolase n=1 Tax=Dyella flava TaxID=1920170 RepID=A0ABS2JXZ5_9GAMM|nr:alpha/beta fold hydrolase [Dyella flava]MBM7123858.1 alpha/beta fold hydrolase [Dyella flava]GLQ52594.1 lipase [Dyella flava]